jgi:putative inorganic carbon (hco3(-)) transporter
MAYALCLIYVVIVYVRPGEIVPEWAGLPIAQVAGGVAAAIAGLSVFLKPRPVAESPVDWCFLGFCLVAIVSNPSHGWFGAGYLTAIELLPLACFYFLIRVTIENRRQMYGLIVLLILLAVFQAVNGIVQFHTGTGIGGSTAVADRVFVREEGEEAGSVMRIRGTGIFNDPNDLAMSLLVVFPFLFSAVMSDRPGAIRRMLAVTSAGILLYALWLTQSRGGFLGFGLLSVAYAYRRFGRIRGLLLAAVFMFVLIAVVGTESSRGQLLDTSDGSSQGRVQAWAAGLEMFKLNPVFGVGFGQFGENYELAAHNSFVHTLAELGFTGGFFFVGMFFWFLAGTGAGRNVAGAASSSLAVDLWASGIGVITCSWFLSRQYIPVLYVPIAMGATRMMIEKSPEGQAPLRRDWDWGRVLILTCGVLVAVYLSVRLLAV